MVTTDICGVADIYEDNVGTGDSIANPVDQWNLLADEPSASLTIAGTILKEAGSWDSDWYVIDTSDLTELDGLRDVDNDYNFRVDATGSISGLYSVKVYRGGTSSQDLECSSTTSGYTSYNDCTYDTYTDNSSYHLGTFSKNCRSALYFPTTRYNYCDDLSNSYYIQIIRDTNQPESCDSYTVSVSNGLTQSGTAVCEITGGAN